jgi:hypothetical protein
MDNRDEDPFTTGAGNVRNASIQSHYRLGWVMIPMRFFTKGRWTIELFYPCEVVKTFCMKAFKKSDCRLDGEHERNYLAKTDLCGG